jgi:hypothetical protein
MRNDHGDKRADRRICSHDLNSLIKNKKTAWDIHGGLKSGDLDDSPLNTIQEERCQFFS